MAGHQGALTCFSAGGQPVGGHYITFPSKTSKSGASTCRIRIGILVLSTAIHLIFIFCTTITIPFFVTMNCLISNLFQVSNCSTKRLNFQWTGTAAAVARRLAQHTIEGKFLLTFLQRPCKCDDTNRMQETRFDEVARGGKPGAGGCENRNFNA